jgi:hypothetical protein
MVPKVDDDKIIFLSDVYHTYGSVVSSAQTCEFHLLFVFLQVNLSLLSLTEA